MRRITYLVIGLHLLLLLFFSWGASNKHKKKIGDPIAVHTIVMLEDKHLPKQIVEIPIPPPPPPPPPEAPKPEPPKPEPPKPEPVAVPEPVVEPVAVAEPPPPPPKPKPVPPKPKPVPVEKPKVMEKPKPVVEKPRPVIEKPKPVVEKPKPVVVKPKPAVAKPKPVVSAPPAPPKPKPKQNSELANLIEKSLSKIEKSEKPKKSSKSITSSPLLSATLEGALDQKSYEKLLINYLREQLELPEPHEVNLELTLLSDGAFCKVKILRSSSEKNRSYMEEQLPAAHFPSFVAYFPDESKRSFTITFKSQK